MEDRTDGVTGSGQSVPRATDPPPDPSRLHPWQPVIIGILSAIAVPKFISATGEAKAAKIQADLRTIGSAVELYYSQNGVYPNSLTDLVSEADGNGIHRRGMLESLSPSLPAIGFDGPEFAVGDQGALARRRVGE